MTARGQAAGAVLDATTATVSQLVRLRTTFMPHIDLYEAYDPDYRARCREAYLYVPEDKTFFQDVVRALTDQLPARRHVVLEQGAFGVGKSLLDIVRGELFGNPHDPQNRALLDTLPRFLREQVEERTCGAGFLVVYIAGAHPQVRERLDRALIEALGRALPATIHVESQFERAGEWVAGIRASGAHSAIRIEELERQLTQQPSSGRSWTLSELEAGLRQRDAGVLEIFRAVVQATIDFHGRYSIPKCRNASSIAAHRPAGHADSRSAPRRLGARRTGRPCNSLTWAIQPVCGTNP
jgi:hypothetical protein